MVNLGYKKFVVKGWYRVLPFFIYLWGVWLIDPPFIVSCITVLSLPSYAAL